MKKIYILLLLFSISYIFCNAQYSIIKTPTNVSVESQDNAEWGSGWIASWEAAAADWIIDHNSDAVRVGPATMTYNCHGYAWHASDGGVSDWVNQNDHYGNPNVEKYWTGTNPTYTLTDLDNATKVFFPDGDHSQISTSTPGKYKSKWGWWPLYIHSCLSHPFEPFTNMACYKLNISGDNFACMSQQKSYSTLNISNATYAWSSYNFSISGSGYSVTGTANINGAGSINVSITSPYSGTTINGKTLTWAGVPILEVTGPSDGYIYNTYTFHADPTGPYSNSSNYSWILNPLLNNNLYDYGDYADIAFYDEWYGYQVLARAQNSCGTGNYAVWNISVYSNGGKSESINENFSISPNPASEIIDITTLKTGNISANNESSETINYTIKIIDFNGREYITVKRSGSYFSIPVNILKDGNYIVQIKNKEKISNLQLIIKHK